MWASGLLREQAGTSWALRPRELGQAGQAGERAGQVARARGLRKEGSWASRERAGLQRGVLGRHREKGEGSGPGSGV